MQKVKASGEDGEARGGMGNVEHSYILDLFIASSYLFAGSGLELHIFSASRYFLNRLGRDATKIWRRVCQGLVDTVLPMPPNRGPGNVARGVEAG